MSPGATHSGGPCRIVGAVTEPRAHGLLPPSALTALRLRRRRGLPLPLPARPAARYLLARAQTGRSRGENQRNLISGLAILGSAIIRPATVLAQQPKKLLPKEKSGPPPGFEERTAQLGYRQGKNFDLEFVLVPSVGVAGAFPFLDPLLGIPHGGRRGLPSASRSRPGPFPGPTSTAPSTRATSTVTPSSRSWGSSASSAIRPT